MSYLLIIFFTVFVATRADLMMENITGVASMNQYHELVVIYTVICALFFAYKTYQHFHFLNTRPRYIHALIFITTSMMIVGAFCPYFEETHWLSFLHVFFSMTSSVFFIMILLIYTHYLSMENIAIYLKTHWFFHVGIQILIALLLVAARVNGLIEILYVSFICIYLLLIEKEIKKT